MKKVGKYVTITFLLLLGLICVGVLYLFFIPKSSLFGITYISKPSTAQSEKFESNKVNYIIVNSRSFDLNILPSENETIYSNVQSNVFGFVLKKHKTPSINASLKNTVLTINIIEPHGFAVQNKSYINLYLPTTSAVNIELNNKAATTTINNENIAINNLFYSSQKGDLKFLKGSIAGNLNLKINKGIVNISNEVYTNKNNLTLEMTTGKFFAKSTSFGEIVINKNNRGTMEISECERLFHNIPDAGGHIYASKISHLNFTSNDTILKIDEIEDGALVTLGGSGNISIGNLNGISTISTNSGSILINNAESPLTLYSKSGDITIKSAKMSTNVNSEYGNVTVHFNETAESYLVNPNSRVLIVKIKNGKLVASGVEHIGKTSLGEGIKVTGNGRVDLTMSNIFGENDVDAMNGDVKIVVNKDSVYELTTSSKKGQVRVNLTQTTEYNGYNDSSVKLTCVNCTSSLNTFNVSTNQGFLTLLDTNFS